jgi:hypothetical protein
MVRHSRSTKTLSRQAPLPSMLSFADGDRAPLSPSASSAFSRAGGRSYIPRQPVGRATCGSRQRGTADAAGPDGASPPDRGKPEIVNTGTNAPVLALRRSWSRLAMTGPHGCMPMWADTLRLRFAPSEEGAWLQWRAFDRAVKPVRNQVCVAGRRLPVNATFLGE